MKWNVEVVPVSMSLEETGYAHRVVNGSRSITITHSTHQNYDHIHTESIGNGYVRHTGIGRRKPDLTPHPEAIIIARALNNG